MRLKINNDEWAVMMSCLETCKTKLNEDKKMKEHVRKIERIENKLYKVYFD